MKKLVLAALGATLMAGFVADAASAAQRHPTRRTVVQAPARTTDDGFRNSYNAYDRPAYSGLAEGGAISAPAGR